MSGMSLLMDLYELTMAQVYFNYKKNNRATFDLFIRQLPVNRKYLVCAGLNDILHYIGNLKFGEKEILYLKSLKTFSPEFLKFLSGFKFSGDIWALPEGEIFFPQEPVLRVSAGLAEAQIIESFLLNTVNLQTMIASKASRVVSVAGGKDIFDFSLRRTHGPEAGIKVARSSYLAGFNGTSNVLAGKLYNIPVAGTMAHSFVMSFKYEVDSFIAYANTFPGKSIFLVDTYDTKKGIENAIKVGHKLQRKGYKLQGIRLDSGDIVFLSKMARRMLDKAGFDFVKIVASGNLDEFKIKGLLDKGACVDIFGVGTHMGTSIDAPVLDVIYKLSEVTDDKGRFIPTMKLSKGKVTYPGRKQVFRIRGSKGKFVKDILGLENEDIKGQKLLKQVVRNGRIVYKIPSLEQTRQFVGKNLKNFPVSLRKLEPVSGYPVAISKGLRGLMRELSSQLEKRQ